jgi:RNA polymerase sigma-70 factor, ECF subfamily
MGASGYEEARRYRRWNGHVRELPVDRPGGPDTTISVDERDLLERAFLWLSPEHRAVFVLHHHVGLPLASIAEVTGVPTGTVKSRLHHAAKQLRAALVAEGWFEREARPA